MQTPALLPQPKRFQRTTGSAILDARCHVMLASADERLQSAIHRWRSNLPAPSGDTRRPVDVRITVDKSVNEKPGGYRLVVTPDAVAIVGASSAGCFYALQTLDQLRGGTGEVPCCEITDWPDFPTRGLLHDVSRGKVPTLDTLKLIVDRLASLKVNQLQLYIEHAFTFEFDPQICGADDGLTPDEVRELDEYCKERFIDLVPAVATLGHMGKILSMPKYRHLAEIECNQSWGELDWPRRARGFTLDIANPESFTLVERIWSEILDAFSGPVVNICGDEPWDLGKGKNAQRFADGIGRPYIDHILRTYDLGASRGRGVQVWSDVICKHPEQFGRLPSDLTVLHWGYDDNADYAGTAAFVKAGLDTFVCPGISGWKRILPAMTLAERNISTFAKAGRQCRAKGLINTDWGDHGHFHTLGSSWHGIALGAACAWTADHPTGSPFDETFGKSVLGLEDPSVMPLLRTAAAIGDACETWRLFWQPAAQMSESPLLAREALEGSCDAAIQASWLLRAACDAAKRGRPSGGATPAPERAQDLADLAIGYAFTSGFVGKAEFARELASGTSDRAIPCMSQLASDLWILQTHGENARFAECWMARNKASGLMDIRRALARVADDVRVAALERRS